MPHRAKQGFVTRIDGQRHRYGRGEEVPDELVEKLGRLVEPVEQATAAPGEKRTLSYECDDCEFTTESKRGLSIHRTSQHESEDD